MGGYLFVQFAGTKPPLSKFGKLAFRGNENRRGGLRRTILDRRDLCRCGWRRRFGFIGERHWRWDAFIFERWQGRLHRSHGLRFVPHEFGDVAGLGGYRRRWRFGPVRHALRGRDVSVRSDASFWHG